MGYWGEKGGYRVVAAEEGAGVLVLHEEEEGVEDQPLHLRILL